VTDTDTDVLQLAGGSLRGLDGAVDARLRDAEVDAAAKLRDAEVDAEAKLRGAEVDAAAKLRGAELDAAAKLRGAELDAEAKLRGAELDAEVTLRRAEVPAAAKLLQAEADAEATLRRAEIPAEEKLVQAEVDAEAILRRAEISAAAKLPQPESDAELAASRLLQAEAKAQATLRQAEIPAAAKLLQAEADARATLRRAEIPAAAKLLQAEADAKATLRQAEQEANHQCDVFERFFALSIDMMCISDPDGRFTHVSPSFELLGYSREEMLSRTLVDLVHPDDKEATQAAYQTLTSESPIINFENRYHCKDGSYRWLSWASGLDFGDIVYSIARDITKAKQGQEAMIRAKNAVQDANRELETFSYSVAHDLRAPLRSIDGFSQALLEDHVEKLDTTGRRYLTVIRESAHHMAQLIDDLLNLSRVTRRDMRCEVIDLSNLARTASRRLQVGQPERRVIVMIQDGLTDKGDLRLLAIVLDNLLGNAWKFTSKRADARIEVGASDKEGQRVYFVRDNGVGFDMALAKDLFGVFQRLHTAESFEGTGIGLATVQRIVGRHGGRAWAEAEIDRGATFYFTLHEPPAEAAAKP
jgi:PAS domain S-box-containing protein